MKKKGFTIVELLGVIVIMATILLVAVPIYNSVREDMNQSLYESKLREVLSKSEIYAEETGKMVFDIKKLLKEGRITADNELEEFLDPRNGRNMACDIINLSYEESLYHASIRESEVCYTEDELESMYGLVHLKILDENKNPIESIPDTIWLKEKKVYVTYEIREENIEIDSLTWTGEESVHCEKEELSRCEFYEITTGSVKNTIATLNLHYSIEGISIDSRVIKEVNLDIQRPQISQISYNNDLYTSQNRRVDFEITDGGGSGVKEYAIVKEKTCKGSEYDQKKKSARDGIQTEYLENGEYYICVEDQVGNRTNDSDLDNNLNKITIDKIDITSSKIYWSVSHFTLGLHDWYRELSLQANIEETESGILASNYCITTNESCVPDDHFVNLSHNQFSVTLDTNRLPQKVCAQVIDKVGNKSEIVCSPFYKVDRTLPSIKSFTASNTWGVSNLLSVTAQDMESGIIGYAFSKSNQIPAIFTSVSSSNAIQNFTSSATSNGTYYVFIKDSAGNISQSDITVSHVDTIIPQAYMNATASGTNVTVDASGSRDNESGIKSYYYQIDGGAWIASSSSNYSFIGLTDGTHNVCLFVEDYASNRSAVVCSQVQVDSWIEVNYPIEKVMSSYYGGNNYRVLVGISAQNVTNFQVYISNSTIYGLFTECQRWKSENNNACSASGRWYGSQNRYIMHGNTMYANGMLSTKYESDASIRLPSPAGPTKCSGSTGGDSGWNEVSIYNPFFYHAYETNVTNYTDPKVVYQKVQFASSVTVQARVVSSDCTCKSSRPDSDTAITCKAHVYVRAKIYDYKLELLTEPKLDQFPNATGYLTNDDLSMMKPTHIAVLVGASWSGSEGSKNANIYGSSAFDIRRYFP